VKKLAIVLSCLALTVACSGEDTKDTDGNNTGGNSNVVPIPDQCSADCNGALVGVNTDTMLCTEYNSSLYSSGNVVCTEECTADTTGCVEAVEPKAAEFQQCVVTGEESNCDTGLECATFDGAAYYCMKPCPGPAPEDDPDADDGCGVNECVALTTTNYCFKKEAQRDAACFDNLKTCVDGAGECTPTDYVDGEAAELRCKITCDIASDGSECPADESCLLDPLPYGTVQQDENEQQVLCTDENAAEVCDPGFECVELSGGTQACFKRNGLCGTSVPACLSIETSEWQACVQDGDLCTPDNGHAYCDTFETADDGTAGAEAYCAEVQGQGQAGICLAYCEGADGDLYCGTDAQCVRPAEVTYYLNVARTDAGEYVDCSVPADCSAYNTDGDLPFDCVELTIGFVCSRALKQCIANEEADLITAANECNVVGAADDCGEVDPTDATDATDPTDPTDATDATDATDPSDG
jgi:hypothetical protein